MNKLELWFPAKPWFVTQAWGIDNPSYLQFGFSKHNGIDFLPGNDKKLYCPVQNLEVYDVDRNDATGWRVKANTVDFYDFPDGVSCKVNMVFMHLEKQSDCKVGDILQVGDLLGVPDNTGFSTGPHTHWLCRRIDKNLNLIDKNDADNSFDQSPYFTRYYACDYGTVKGLMTNLLIALQKLVDLLTKKG